MMKRTILFILISIVIIGTMACQIANKHDLDYSENSPSNSSEDKTDVESDSNNPEDRSNEDNNPATDDPNNNTTTVYFGDSQALGLTGEERTIQDITPETLINELIKGPQNPDNSRTISEGTKLLGVEIKDKTAYANFSKELKDNHWGGSTGETFTIYSIVNTLVLQPNLDIEQVQILIEGETVETLAGHADISVPLESNLEIVDMK